MYPAESRHEKYPGPSSRETIAGAIPLASEFTSGKNLEKNEP